MGRHIVNGAGIVRRRSPRVPRTLGLRLIRKDAGEGYSFSLPFSMSSLTRWPPLWPSSS